MNNYNNIPKELKGLKQWVGFSQFDRDNGKVGKMPINPLNLKPAKANDPNTWTTYSNAVNAVGSPVTFYVNGEQHKGKIDGIGIQFGNGLFGIDLDDVVRSGYISDDAKEIIRTVDSYTEYSPSGNGIHILCFGEIPEGNRRKGFIEMYGETRFFTVTGNVITDYDKINERTEQAKIVHEKYLGTPQTKTQTKKETVDIAYLQSDDELIRMMFNSFKGSEIKQLMIGNMSIYNDDHSAADFALVNHLCYWTNGNAAKIDSIFRTSGLMREKWDRPQGDSTYGEITINKVLRDFKPYTNTPVAININGKRVGAPYGTVETRNAKEVETPTKVANEPYKSLQTAKNYLLKTFKGDRDRFKNYKQRKTGYENMDNITGGLYPGLYVIGALSSLGKTTYMHQMADQLAEQGEKVLFFSLEQSSFEMSTKSLSRETYKLNPSKKDLPSAIEIRKGEHTQSTNAALKNYMEYADNLYIIECNFNFTMNDIISTVEHFIETEQTHPVVIIDYLQIIPSVDPRMSDKEKTDQHVRALKILQRDHDLVVFAISSLNRSNYLSPVSFESFKESGGIEYTADVVLGMQYSILNDDLFSKDNKKNDKIDLINQAKRATPRKIELVCLKNRYGRDYTVGFDYYPRHDYFTPSNDYGDDEYSTGNTPGKIRTI